MPLQDAGVGNGRGETLVPDTHQVAIFGAGNDARCAIQLALFDNQRLRKEGLDYVRRDTRNGRFVGGRINLRLKLDGAAGAGLEWFANAETGRRTRAVEEYDFSRVNQVGVLDLVTVHVPDFRPAPRFLEEFSGDTPKRVATHHNVAIGGVVDELQGLGGRCANGRHGQDERGYNADHSRNLMCRRNTAMPTWSYPRLATRFHISGIA